MKTFSTRVINNPCEVINNSGWAARDTHEVVLDAVVSDLMPTWLSRAS